MRLLPVLEWWVFSTMLAQGHVLCSSNFAAAVTACMCIVSTLWLLLGAAKGIGSCLLPVWRQGKGETESQQ